MRLDPIVENGKLRAWTRKDEERSARIMKRAKGTGMRTYWPYGLPEGNLDAREAAVEWARANRLHWSRRFDCLHWLVQARCDRPGCPAWDRSRGFGRLGGHDIHLSDDWVDHVSAWDRDGQSAVLVAQPYSLLDTDREGLVRLGDGLGLRVEIDDAGGWYGHRTIWIAIWRDGDVSQLQEWLQASRRYPGPWPYELA